MATPITWQNINAPSLADASRPLESAQRSINGSFDILDNLMLNERKVDAANVATEQNANKQAYLDLLQGYSTPEALEAARLDGTLQQRMQALSPNMRAQVRGADEARLASVRNQVTQGQQFGDTQRARQYEPLRQKVLSLAAQGNDKDALEILSANPDMPNAADITKAIVTGKQNTQKFGRDMQVIDSNLQTADADRKLKVFQSDAAELALGAAKTDAAEKEVIDRVVGERLKSFNNSMSQMKLGLQSTAKDFGVPLDDAGMPDVTKLAPDQLAAFQQALKQRGLDTPMSSSAAVKETKDSLIAAGVRATSLPKADPLLGQFVARGVLSPEDKAIQDRQLAAIDTRVENIKANNPFYTPPNELLKSQAAVLAQVDALVTDGPMTKSGIRDKMNEWMNTGIEINKGGKKVLVKVPPKVMEMALKAGLESDSWIWNSTTGNTKKILESIMTSAEYDKQRAEAEDLMAGGNIYARDQVLRQSASNAGVTTPVDNKIDRQSVLKDAAREVKRQEEILKKAAAARTPVTQKSGRPPEYPVFSAP